MKEIAWEIMSWIHLTRYVVRYALDSLHLNRRLDLGVPGYLSINAHQRRVFAKSNGGKNDPNGVCIYIYVLRTYIIIISSSSISSSSIITIITYYNYDSNCCGSDDAYFVKFRQNPTVSRQAKREYRKLGLEKCEKSSMKNRMVR